MKIVIEGPVASGKGVVEEAVIQALERLGYQEISLKEISLTERVITAMPLRPTYLKNAPTT